MKTLILFIFLSLPFNLSAKTYLAFFEFYNYQGELIQMEKDGRFSHVAISNGDFWLHAHPGKGFVEAVNTIEEMNFYKAKTYIYELDTLDIPSIALTEYIGEDYDRSFNWNNRALYNAELIALILDIKPTPMDFSSSYWNNMQTMLPIGQLGLSPDDIFEEILSRGFQEVRP